MIYHQRSNNLTIKKTLLNILTSYKQFSVERPLFWRKFMLKQTLFPRDSFLVLITSSKHYSKVLTPYISNGLILNKRIIRACNSLFYYIFYGDYLFLQCSADGLSSNQDATLKIYPDAHFGRQLIFCLRSDYLYSTDDSMLQASMPK